MQNAPYDGSDAVARKIRAWQDALIDLTRRNPLLSLPTGVTSLLRIPQPPPDALYKTLAGRRRKLTFVPAALSFSPEPRPLKAGQCQATEAELKVLNNLRLKARLSLTEQGINVLFLALGVLEWPDPKSGARLRSPLLLVPAALERLPAGDGFALGRFEDDVRANPTLRHRLAQSDVALRLPDIGDDEDLVPSAYLQAVADGVAARPGWRVLPDECLLGRFSYLKLVMHEDLCAHAPMARTHPLIGALAGDPNALDHLPAIDVPDVRALDARCPPGDNLHVLDADPSQERAIVAARRGQSFVLQGPPGTGKTQTIANIIAACIADNKRVLFVSEKMAALDAVYKRLRDRGLADLCLEAHSHKANKKDVLEQLGRALNARPAPAEGRAAHDGAGFLGTIRDELNATVRALHARREPLGLSVYEANGIVAGLGEDVPDLPFVFTGPDAVSAADYHRLEGLAERLAAYHDLFEQAETHPWRGIRAERFTVELQTRVRSTVSDLLLAADALQAQTAGLARACGVAERTDAGARHTDWLLALADLAERTPCPPAAWVISDEAAADELRQLAQACRARYDRFTRDRKTLLSAYAETVFTLPHDELAGRLTARHEPLLRPALGANWAEATGAFLGALDATLARVAERADRLRRGIDLLAPLCGMGPAGTLAFARHARDIAALALADPHPQPDWLAEGAVPALLHAAGEARGNHEGLVRRRAELLTAYTDAVLRLDLPALRQRFATDYAGLSRIVKPGYWRDRKQVAGMLHPGKTIRGRDLARDLGLAQAINDHAAWVQQNQPRLQQIFGTHYRGGETDWAALEQALRQTEAVVSGFGGHVPDVLARRLVVSGAEMQTLRDQHALFTRQLAETETELGAQGELAGLATLPLADTMPVAQVPLADITAWCGQVRDSAQDFHDARKEALSARRVSPFGAPADVRDFAPPVPTAQLAADLREAKRLAEEEEAIDRESDALRARYAAFFSGLETDWDAVLAALDWVDRLRALWAGKSHPMPDAFVGLVTGRDGAARGDVAARRRTLQAKREQAQPFWTALADLFEPERLRTDETGGSGQALEHAPYDRVRDWLEVRLGRLPEMEHWIGFRNLRQECADAGMLSFFEVTTHRRPAAGVVLPAFRKGFHRRWLDAVTDPEPLLRRFRGGEHEARRARFAALDHEQIDRTPARVRAEAHARRPRADGMRSDIGEIGVLKKQLAMKRPWAIRKLLSAMPNLLFTLKPCLMMSPLSVSLFLDADTVWFDLVIFDEASQIFTESAVGALLRAKQAVIAGDTRQLPPTSFFLGLKDEDETDEEDEGGVSLAEFESVLKAADAVAARTSSRFAEHPLDWHYRSRHESLIAFSRRHFYDTLISFPSASLGSAVRFVHVPDGVYYGGKGAARNNPVEAARVADLVIEHVRAHPAESVGVIAMSEAQQAAIWAEVERRKREDPETLTGRFSEEGSEGFFVKNIENVQGDERDVIFLSIGYGRDPSGKFSMNFGPINQEGGERRLNVAVTRARLRCTVVASLLPSDIDPSRTEKLGPRLLRAYLEHAAAGTAGSTENEDRAPDEATAEHPGPLVGAVESALSARGYTLRRQVGLFDYRVDLAVVDGADPQRFLLGIEGDGPVYASGETARARERLRGEVLRRLGWRLHRVWSADWVRDPDGALFAIEQAIDRAKRGEPADTSIIAPAPARPESAEAPHVAEPHTPSTELPPQAGASNDHAAANGGLLPGLVCFLRAELCLSNGPATLYSDERRDQEERLQTVQQLVQLEGPLPADLVAQRLAGAAGLERAGAQVQRIAQAAIRQLVARNRIEQRGGFLWHAGMTTAPARVPRDGGTPRPIEHICTEEIGEVILVLLRAGVGMRRDEAVSETARLLGFSRTGANVAERIQAALSALELDSRVHIRGGQVYTFET